MSILIDFWGKSKLLSILEKIVCICIHRSLMILPYAKQFFLCKENFFIETNCLANKNTSYINPLIVNATIISGFFVALRYGEYKVEP